MAETKATLTELRQNLATLINRAAFGGERIVLVSHGEPKAAIISIEELRRLEAIESDRDGGSDRFACALAEATALRKELEQWQREQGIAPEDSTETLRRLREERDEQILGLR